MGFFENTKSAGWAIVGSALLMILSGVFSIVDGLGGDNAVGFIVGGIGLILSSMLYLKFGNAVRIGRVTGKMEVVGNFVKVVGYAVIVSGFFGVVGGLLGSGDTVGSLLYIVCGFVVIWVSKKMMDNKATFFDSLVWIILMAVFLILFTSSFLGIFINGFELLSTLTCVCKAVIYLIMFVFLLDRDVKRKMGM